MKDLRTRLLPAEPLIQEVFVPINLENIRGTQGALRSPRSCGGSGMPLAKSGMRSASLSTPSSRRRSRIARLKKALEGLDRAAMDFTEKLKFVHEHAISHEMCAYCRGFSRRK
ncbi:hypothetical protein SEVIR_7G286651v4 [Setaria viridis]|uniref:Uncharacterized protein n=1 Tax=Setaria viridis TaxID=4556 RepID=A0A4U6TZ70_SETVI|nr:hypothetical protein SEVIR_7G286651v2 [Setaria viridis]